MYSPRCTLSLHLTAVHSSPHFPDAAFWGDSGTGIRLSREEAPRSTHPIALGWSPGLALTAASCLLELQAMAQAVGSLLSKGSWLLTSAWPSVGGVNSRGKHALALSLSSR